MSGGSYNYLCFALDIGELHTRINDLDEMTDRLAALGYADDAARESAELLARLRQWDVRATVAIKRLRKVWEAVEYWDSSDAGEDDVRAALAEYRGDTTPATAEQPPAPPASAPPAAAADEDEGDYIGYGW
ncbi:hypothetical protein ACIBSV_12180 [Embleya sp. NPDC050154]|uniref:hypothetical protein n=1 Tax=Embleya sp. NPDC050154 TaxID=3363988 RepID=UPI00378AD962